MDTGDTEKKVTSKRGEPAAVPEGFFLAMALIDCLPVLFFSLSSGILASRFDSTIFRVGVALVIFAGALKAGWKFVIALLHKDFSILSRQMRFLMPAGFLLVLISLFVDRGRWSLETVVGHILHMPALAFFLCGSAGMVMMVKFAMSGNSRNAKQNWKEQIVNSFSQFCIMLGILL